MKMFLFFQEDSGFNNKEKLNKPFKILNLEGIKVVIGPIEHEDLKMLKNIMI